MKRRTKIIIVTVIAGLLIIIGLVLNYRSFQYDRWRAQMNYDSMKLFHVYIVEDENEPSMIALYAKYTLKKITFQDIQYEDLIPELSLVGTEKDPSKPAVKSTEECVENFNNNLLNNPDYEQLAQNIQFDEPITVNDLFNDVRKIIDLIDEIGIFSHGRDTRSLVNNPYPYE